MFKNMGGKIKKLAKFICWLGIVISILVGLSMMLVGFLSLDMFEGQQIMGFTFNGTMVLVIGGALVMVLGSLYSWIQTMFLYGVGELIENHSIETAIMVKHEIQG